MIRSLLALVLVGIGSFSYTDLDSESVIRGVLLPLVDVAVLIALAVWFALLFHRLGVARADGASAYDGSIGMGEGGDSGGDA